MHGDKLIKRVEQNREVREQQKIKDNLLNGRVREIKDAPKRQKTDFWCEDCQKDFSGIGYKEVRERPTFLIAWYTGFCPMGHKCIRRITDKVDDPYYHLSLMVRRQRVDFGNDLVQPGDPRFARLYPEQFKKLQDQRE